MFVQLPIWIYILKKTGPIKLELLRVLMDTESKSFCKLVLFIHSPAPLCNVFSVIKGRGAKVELLCHSGGEWIWLGMSDLLLSISYWKGWGYADLKTHSCPGSLIHSSSSPSWDWKYVSKHTLFVEKKSSFLSQNCLLEQKPAYLWKFTPKMCLESCLVY